MALTRKLVSVKIFTSNNFRTHTQREREREGEERAQITPQTQSPDHAFNFVDLRTHEPIFDLEPSTHRSMNPWTDLRPRAFDFTGDPEPLRHKPTNRSLSVWFWFFVWFWSTHEPIYVSVWFWFFTLSLWSLFFCCCYGGVGGSVLVVFLLGGGGFYVGGGGK